MPDDIGAYKQAGVDIDLASRAKQLIKSYAHSTFRPEVLSDVGFFGALFELKGLKNPVLVSSTDGVGTKLKIAILLDRHDTIGADLVNHCINDIFVCGAEPLFFLDYIGQGKLSVPTVEGIVKGVAAACRQSGCALVGGETAEMPGLYAVGDYDLVGFIVGAVEKAMLINGSGIAAGDVLLGLPSSGLHTNGYSLVRKVFKLDGPPPEAARNLERYYPELGCTLGEELLKTHVCYYPLLKNVLPLVKGLAHITGGGFFKNVPRILPDGLAASLIKSSWPVLPIFKLIQEAGGVDPREMYKVFNMGLGMVVACSPENRKKLLSKVAGAIDVGRVVEQRGVERVIFT